MAIGNIFSGLGRAATQALTTYDALTQRRKQEQEAQALRGLDLFQSLLTADEEVRPALQSAYAQAFPDIRIQGAIPSRPKPFGKKRARDVLRPEQLAKLPSQLHDEPIETIQQLRPDLVAEYSGAPQAPDFEVTLPDGNKVKFSQLPAGAQSEVVRQMYAKGAQVEITVPGRGTFRVSPEKAIEYARDDYQNQRNRRYTFVAPDGTRFENLTPGEFVGFVNAYKKSDGGATNWKVLGQSPSGKYKLVQDPDNLATYVLGPQGERYSIDDAQKMAQKDDDVAALIGVPNRVGTLQEELQKLKLRQRALSERIAQHREGAGATAKFTLQEDLARTEAKIRELELEIESLSPPGPKPGNNPVLPPPAPPGPGGGAVVPASAVPGAATAQPKWQGHNVEWASVNGKQYPRTTVASLGGGGGFGEQLWKQRPADLINAIAKAEGNPRNHGLLVGSQAAKPGDSDAVLKSKMYRVIETHYRSWVKTGKPGDFLDYLRDKWAPLGAGNDPARKNHPHGLNVYWLGNVLRGLGISVEPGLESADMDIVQGAGIATGVGGVVRGGVRTGARIAGKMAARRANRPINAKWRPFTYRPRPVKETGQAITKYRPRGKPKFQYKWNHPQIPFYTE